MINAVNKEWRTTVPGIVSLGLIISQDERVALITARETRTGLWGWGSPNRSLRRLRQTWKDNKIKVFWDMTPCQLETLTFRRSLLSLSSGSIFSCQNNIKRCGTRYLAQRYNDLRVVFTKCHLLLTPEAFITWHLISVNIYNSSALAMDSVHWVETDAVPCYDTEIMSKYINFITTLHYSNLVHINERHPVVLVYMTNLIDQSLQFRPCTV
jgi:hypothetical protein